jgi:mono/diheme cytochrome c family protein
MCPSVIDDQWTFGSDDETLFKLIKGEIPHQTMPTMFGSELSDAQIWQVLAYVRSVYKGDPSKINW